jgi:hypothetical protein
MTEDTGHAGRAHAALGASNSSIWLNCTGSYALSLGRERKGTVYTREGTAAHELAELHLAHVIRGSVPPQTDTVEVEGHEIDVTDEMIQGVGRYVAVAAALIEKAIWHGIEVRVSLAELWAPGPAPLELFGTADCIALDHDGKLTVCDLKFGKGKMVSPEENSQLLYYGLGAYFALPPELRLKVRDVELIIVQPRAKGDKVKEWSIHVIDLLMWADHKLKVTVDNIASGKTSLVSGNHCFFCVAAPVCPELHEAKVRRAVEAFPDIQEDAA